MLTTQLENVSRLGKFPITTTELNEEDYQNALAEFPIASAMTKEECRAVVQALQHVATIARMNDWPRLRGLGVVYLPVTQRFSLFAAHEYGMMVVDLTQSFAAATKWRDMRGKILDAQDASDARAWYSADDVWMATKLLKDASHIYATVANGALTMAGALKTGQRYVISISEVGHDGVGVPPLSLLNLVNRDAQVSVVFANVASLAELKKRGREVARLLRERDNKRYHLAELHLFARPDQEGAVFFKFPQVLGAEAMVSGAVAVAPFDLVALDPELLVLPDRGSVSVYIPPAEPKPWEPEGTDKKYVQKPLQMQWLNGHFVVWELIMPSVPHHLR